MEAILRATSTNTWITLVLFISVLFVAMAKNLFHARFFNFIILPFNSKYIFLYNKKGRIFNWFNIFFTLFQILNFSLFIYLVSQVFFKLKMGSLNINYLIVLGSTTLFMLLKGIFQFGNGYVFNINHRISEFIFKRLTYLNYSGIVMFIANVILTFVIKDSIPVIYGSVFLIILLNAIGWLTILRNHQNYLSNNFFYFILYLCTLEIAPLLILGSYLKD
ncbi:MAG: DUF4271 domain-containing protein [Cellulophaga sp.]